MSVFPVNRVPDILKRMDVNCSQAEAMKTCFGILAIMSREDINKLLIAKDGMEIILNAMTVHVDRTDVQESGCDLLWSLAFNSSSVKELIAKYGGATVLVRALKRHSRSADFLKSACGALSNMCQNKLNQEGVSSQGGLQPLVGSIHIHQTNTKLLPFIFDAIASIIVNNEENARTVSTLGIIPVIVSALSRHKPSMEVVKSGCHTLAILSDVKGQASKIAFAGGVPIILSLLDAHPLYSDLHRVAAVVLLRMLQESAHVGREISSHEGIRILLNSLEKGGAQQDTVAAVTHILYTVTNPSSPASSAIESQLWIQSQAKGGNNTISTDSADETNKKSTTANNDLILNGHQTALGGVVTILGQYSSRRDVVRAACRLINNLSGFSNVIIALDKLFILERMLECVYNHKETKDVVDSTASFIKSIYRRGAIPSLNANSIPVLYGLIHLFRVKLNDEEALISCANLLTRISDNQRSKSANNSTSTSSNNNNNTINSQNNQTKRANNSDFDVDLSRIIDGKSWEGHAITIALGILDNISEMEKDHEILAVSSNSNLVKSIHNLKAGWTKGTSKILSTLLDLIESLLLIPSNGTSVSNSNVSSPMHANNNNINQANSLKLLSDFTMAKDCANSFTSLLKVVPSNSIEISKRLDKLLSMVELKKTAPNEKYVLQKKASENIGKLLKGVSNPIMSSNLNDDSNDSNSLKNSSLDDFIKTSVKNNININYSDANKNSNNTNSNLPVVAELDATGTNRTNANNHKNKGNEVWMNTNHETSSKCGNNNNNNTVSEDMNDDNVTISITNTNTSLSLKQLQNQYHNMLITMSSRSHSTSPPLSIQQNMNDNINHLKSNNSLNENLPKHPCKQSDKNKLLETWPNYLERLLISPTGSRSYLNLPQQETCAPNRMHLCYEGSSAAGRNVLSRIPTPVPYVVPPNGLGEPFAHSLTFDSEFESGNLLRSVQKGDNSYDLFLRSDLHTPGHTQWFYFAVSNTHSPELINLIEQQKMDVSPVKVKFNIVNLTKPDSLFNLGMRPVIYSVMDATNKSTGWVRAGSDISYYSNSFVRNNNAGEGLACYYTLSFTIDFSNPRDTVLIAYSYPYTISDYKSHVNQLLAKPHASDIIRQSKLCLTLGGEECDLLVITKFKDKDRIGPITVNSTLAEDSINIINNSGISSNNTSSKSNSSQMNASPLQTSKSNRKNSNAFKEGNNNINNNKDGNNNYKPAIFISARVHPGETPASWMMKGILDFLTSDTSQAKLLRQVYVIFIVPMLNPDGVIYGNNRCSLAGVDLNRQWKVPMKAVHPTIYYLKSFMTAQRRIREISMYIDLHGHSRKYNVFMYGCEDKKRPKPQVRAFPKFFSMHQMGRKYVSYADCSFHVRKGRESTARVVVSKEMNIPCSFTLEATFCGSNYGVLKYCHMNIGHLQEVGAALCDAFLNYSISEGRVKDATLVPANMKAVAQIEKAIAAEGLNADTEIDMDDDGNMDDQGDMNGSSDINESVKSTKKSNRFKVKKMDVIMNDNSKESGQAQAQAMKDVAIEDQITDEIIPNEADSSLLIAVDNDISLPVIDKDVDSQSDSNEGEEVSDSESLATNSAKYGGSSTNNSTKLLSKAILNDDSLIKKTGFIRTSVGNGLPMPMPMIVVNNNTNNNVNVGHGTKKTLLSQSVNGIFQLQSNTNQSNSLYPVPPSSSNSPSNKNNNGANGFGFRTITSAGIKELNVTVSGSSVNNNNAGYFLDSNSTIVSNHDFVNTEDYRLVHGIAAVENEIIDADGSMDNEVSLFNKIKKTSKKGSKKLTSTINNNNNNNANSINLSITGNASTSTKIKSAPSSGTRRKMLSDGLNVNGNGYATGLYDNSNKVFTDASGYPTGLDFEVLESPREIHSGIAASLFGRENRKSSQLTDSGDEQSHSKERSKNNAVLELPRVNNPHK
eukprot:gene5033-7023_t